MAATTDVPSLITELLELSLMGRLAAPVAAPRIGRLDPRGPTRQPGPAACRSLSGRLPREAAARHRAGRAASAPCRPALHRARLTPTLWTELKKAGPGDPSPLPSAVALSPYDPDSPRWSELGGKVAEVLVKVNPSSSASGSMRCAEAGPARGAAREDLRQGRLRDRGTLGHEPPRRLRRRRPGPARRPAHGRRFQGVPGVPPACRRTGRNILFQAQLAKSQGARKEEADTEQAKDQLAEGSAGGRGAGPAGLFRRCLALVRHSTDPRLRSFIVNWLSP